MEKQTKVPEVDTLLGATPATRPHDFIYDTIGEVGKWQMFVLLVLSVSKFSVGFHQLSTVFIAVDVDYHCELPNNTTDVCSPDCEKVWYDRSTFEETAITEWGLICDKRHYPNIAQSIFMLGILIGNISFGIWSDRSGRRPPLLFAAVLQLVAGVLAAFSPWFWLFVFLRFLTAVATGGNMITSFCVVMEIIGPSKRELLTNTIHLIPFYMGHALLAVFAYFIRNFRMYQFALSIFSALYLSYFCLVPESPRWLMLTGRLDESTKILEKAARMNGRPTDKIRQEVENAHQARVSKVDTSKGNVFDLLRTPRLRTFTLSIFVNWFAVGFNYFGVAAYVGQLGGNIFLNVAISGLFSIPGVIMSVPACKYLGRKPTLIIAHLVIGTCLFGYIFVPQSMKMLQLLLVSTAVFGAAICFPTCYLYAGEIFPTVARNSGCGVASMLARIGAMCAAFGTSLSVLGVWVPPFMFSVISLVALLCALLLPETKNQALPETIEEAENYGKKNK